MSMGGGGRGIVSVRALDAEARAVAGSADILSALSAGRRE